MVHGIAMSWIRLSDFYVHAFCKTSVSSHMILTEPVKAFQPHCLKHAFALYSYSEDVSKNEMFKLSKLRPLQEADLKYGLYIFVEKEN